ncbi:CinA family protein [Corallococcus sp. ZKHCc1 1396]|uniref:CinA family protein n=1 Tax=Corallococcus soli TaxID=2710757 RepID=A0ABR9PFK2_9BACT|nr:CinA family protein [Corallococcus soli]
MSDLEGLAPRVIARCRELKLRLVLAEACTGGLITAALTDVPGASAVVERAFVPYSNESKGEQLGVPLALLREHGSVSAQAVGAMVEGALQRSWADWGVAETGIAGPGGGTEAKPVGLVFVAVQRRGSPAVVERHLFPGDRRAVRQAASARGLALLLEQLAVES